MSVDYTGKVVITIILVVATVFVAINHFTGTGDPDMRPLLFILFFLTLASALWAWLDYKRRQAATGEGLEAATKAKEAARAAEDARGSARGA